MGAMFSVRMLRRFSVGSGQQAVVCRPLVVCLFFCIRTTASAELTTQRTALPFPVFLPVVVSAGTTPQTGVHITERYNFMPVRISPARQHARKIESHG